MWSVDDPAQVALIGFGGTLVTAAAGVIAARLADHRDRDGSTTIGRILDELDELRERVGVLEHERGLAPAGRRRRGRRPAPPA